MSDELFSPTNSDTVKIRPPAPNPLEARSQKRDLLAEQNQDWAEDHPFPPEHYLERWPVDFKADPDGASVLVAEIFQRRQRGERPSLDEYERRFPDHFTLLGELIGRHELRRLSGGRGHDQDC